VDSTACRPGSTQAGVAASIASVVVAAIVAHEVQQPAAAGSAPEPQPRPLPAWVTLAQANVLCTAGVAATFVADFDRQDGVTHSAAESALRITRPGAIVLANLDLDNPPSPRPANLISVLNANDNVINGAQDERGLTLLKLRRPQPCAIVATQVKLVCHADDAKRIRVFQVGLASGAPQLGEGSAGGRELVLPMAPNLAIDYRIEALTLPGDPALPAPTAAPPSPPEGLSATLPAGASAGNPIYARRAPADVWLELMHTVAAGQRAVRDVGLVTIAPWIMLPNTRPITRLYFTYLPPTPSDAGNHHFAYDMCEALATVFGAANVPLNPDESVPFTPSTPASTQPVYLIDGARFSNDVWIQDEIEIGYCWAPHAWMHVVLHPPRRRELTDFVTGEMAAPGIGVFDKVPGVNRDGVDYGGNIECSPPVRVATPALPRTPGGPSVPAHPPAPFGKILVGDCTPRPLSQELHDFFVAQKVQPVLPIDTSWLHVGHTDEIMSIVRSTGGKRFKLVMASVRAMDSLLRNLARVPLSSGRTGFHAGLIKISASPANYAERSVEQLRSHLGGYNGWLHTNKLRPIQTRLQRGLGLSDADVIPLPTYFELPDDRNATIGSATHRTIAYTVGSVNMQIAGRHLLVPRPMAARLRPDDARRVVAATMAEIGWQKPVIVAPSSGFYFWGLPGYYSLSTIAAAFTFTPTAARRQNIVDAIDGRATLTPDNAAAVRAKTDEIRRAPENAAGPNPLSGCLAGDAFTKCKRVFIPHDTVDVLEVYIRSVLEGEGNVVHFIDDWYNYHEMSGEVHCGTNVVRTPPEVDASFRARWWDHYDPNLDHDYAPGR
jgi:hypothetical protein